MSAKDREIEAISAELERLRAHADLVHRVASEPPDHVRTAVRAVADRSPLTPEDVDVLALWSRSALVAGLVDEVLKTTRLKD